jgi:ATP/maltotriose-dependent transcriptional regulator MalT
VDERLRRPRLVGRTRELALLGERLAAASAGHAAAVTIGGDAGSGRTRLLQEFLDHLPAPATVLRGTCYDGSEPPVPFAPLREAFRDIPVDGEDVLDPADLLHHARAEVFDRLVSRLGRLGRVRPVVLAVDDVHLADRPTLDLLAFLVSNLRATRTLVVMTWCSEKLPGTADLRPWVAGLAGDAGVTRVDLAPLTRDELTALLADACGGGLDESVATACWVRSEGNPFVAVELLGPARIDPRCPLPATLADLMLARLDALGCRARHVVRVAAAAGPRVDHRLLAAVAGLPAEALYAALHEAVDAQVLVPGGDGEDYRFRHAILHEAAYAQLLPGERRHILGRVPTPRLPRLTPRELQVLSLVASGDSNRDIARELFISEKTASVHVSNILAKLGARSRTAAAAAAHRLGVLR